MIELVPKVNSLVLYKKRPARVLKLGERLDIELESGDVARVRVKDVEVLHLGPLNDLKALGPLPGDEQDAWELLAESGEAHSLAELAELGFGDYTPQTAWAAWLWVEDGARFRGQPQAITALSAEEAAREAATRLARRQETEAWNDFIQRAQQDQAGPQDERYVREVEDLALGRRKDSRVLRELGRHERPETAHARLLAWQVWPITYNPYPARWGLAAKPPTLALPPLPDEPRLDLTGLTAYAIDDEGNQDPDDALSLIDVALDDAGELQSARFWVHVADAAALVPPDSPADLEARARGATLYLPEGAVPMLPPDAVPALGLGLHEVSPALSLRIELNAAAQPVACEIHPSMVRVTRLSYPAAELALDANPHLAGLHHIAQAIYQRRLDSGAFMLDLPEVQIHVVDGVVQITPLERLQSRNMVREAMLVAGEAAGQYAIQHGLAFPFVLQEGLNVPPDAGREVQAWAKQPPALLSMAQRFALRRFMKRSQASAQPGPHGGIGFSIYSRVTSPLRRYLDLLAHQQLRAHLSGRPVLQPWQMIERVALADSLTGSVAQAEAFSRRHWTLVFLLQHPDWRGEAVLVDKANGRGRILIPELAYEGSIALREDIPLDARMLVKAGHINLPDLDAQFLVSEWLSGGDDL